MPKYYVNKNAQPTGEHEVHKEGCSYMPSTQNAEYLGVFLDCYGAVAEAKRVHPNWDIDGCAHCSPDCHTK